MGRLTRDPEVREVGDSKVANFSIAVDRDVKNKQTGERETDFIDCTAWGGRAVFVENYFRKGSMIVVSGRLQMRKWEDKDGNKRVSAEIRVDDAYFGESKQGGSGLEGFAPVGSDDDVPF
jgi:single-strand DNA-binding protein